MTSNDPFINSFRFTIITWTPFAFCAFLTGLVMYTLSTTGRYEAALPAFFAFLPMTFFFSAFSSQQSTKEMRRLRERIRALENTSK